MESGSEGRADGQQVAADTAVKANPSIYVTHAKGKSVNGGADLDFTGINDNNDKRGGTVIENLEVNEGESNVKEVNALGGVNANHNGVTNGYTKLDKAKPKWTRVPCMECGSGKEEEGVASSILGKRGAA